MVKSCVVVILLFSLLPTHSFGIEEKSVQEPGVFSDEDLQEYSDRSDNESSSVTGPQKRKGNRKTAVDQKKGGTADKQYWCKQGTLYRAKVVKAKNEVKDAEREFSEREYEYYRGTTSSKYATAKKNLEKARSRLEKAEQDLSDIENEAHRNWIPPGWLRCQFE
ncbi:MAG: hypothetical protein ACM34I_12880 [bacterium]